MTVLGEKENGLNSITARAIIERVGGQGTPPEYGFQYFTAGLDLYLGVIDDEYLKSFIKDGGSAFKMIVETYGGGKTHFLYSIRELSWKYDYLTSYVSLSPDYTPFHKLEQVYKSIVENLIYPQSAEDLLSEYERGIDAVIKKWYYGKYSEFSSKMPEDRVVEELKIYISSLESYESSSFRNAVKEAFLALVDKRDDDFGLIMQWLKGESPPKAMVKKFKIFEKIDKSTAFKMIRSLVQWVREIEYSGLIVLMDEAEQSSSMSSKQKELLLNNLRELIDECGHTNFKHTLWFYAVPDESFLQGKTQIYVALTQRLLTLFDAEINPHGVKISLEKTSTDPVSLLKEIGHKLAKIYETAYEIKFEDAALNETIDQVAQAAYKMRLVEGYKRLFVQKIIQAFNLMRKTGKSVSPADIGIST